MRVSVTFMEWEMGKLGGFFRITHHRDFSAGRTSDAVDNLFKPLRHFVTIGGFAALIAHMGRYVLDNNNAAAHVGSKGREPILYHPFAHKTDHSFFKYTEKSKTCKSSFKFTTQRRAYECQSFFYIGEMSGKRGIRKI